MCQIVLPFIHSILQKVAAASSRYPGAQLTHPSATTYTRNSIISGNAQKITQPRQINLYGTFVSDCLSIYTFNWKGGCGFIQISLCPAYPSIRHHLYPTCSIISENAQKSRNLDKKSVPISLVNDKRLSFHPCSILREGLRLYPDIPLLAVSLCCQQSYPQLT